MDIIEPEPWKIALQEMQQCRLVPWQSSTELQDEVIWAFGRLEETYRRWRKQTMTEQELRKALDGLFAYDTGSIASGIKDEHLRERCAITIQALPRGSGELVPRLWLSRLIRDMWLAEEALAQGYGIEDALRFLVWMDETFFLIGFMP